GQVQVVIVAWRARQASRLPRFSVTPLSCRARRTARPLTQLREYEDNKVTRTQTRLPGFQRRPAALRQPEMLARAGEDGSCPRQGPEGRRLDSRARPSLRQAEAARLH